MGLVIGLSLYVSTFCPVNVSHASGKASPAACPGGAMVTTCDGGPWPDLCKGRGKTTVFICSDFVFMQGEQIGAELNLILHDRRD